MTAVRTLFDTALRGDPRYAGWSAILPAVTAVLIVVLLGIGVWPRLAEHRG